MLPPILDDTLASHDSGARVISALPDPVSARGAESPEERRRGVTGEHR
jgi:hypothetical protein